MITFLGYALTNPFRSKVPQGFYDPIKGHTGTDWVMPIGTPIMLPISLTFKDIFQGKETGLNALLEDKDGNTLVFSHLSSVKATKGDILLPNTVFALSGNSGGKTTGPHVHWEVIAKKPAPGLEFMTRSFGGVDGFNIDPVAYLERITAPHWSDEDMTWAVTHGLLGYKHNPDDPVKFGELVVFSRRLAKRIIEWVNNPVTPDL